MIVEVWFDGGCRPNPGPAASAAIVRDMNGHTLRHCGRAHEHATVNVAEWTGFIMGLEAARDLGATEVYAFGDSKLVIEQFSGRYAIHAEDLRPLALAASSVAQTFPGGVTATWVPRERNAAADAICNAVMARTYVGDGETPLAAPPVPTPIVTVSFVVEVAMDASEAATAGSDRAAAKTLRNALAERAERKLIMCGAIGGDVYRVSRVKG